VSVQNKPRAYMRKQESVATRCSKTGETGGYLNRLFSKEHDSADPNYVFEKKLELKLHSLSPHANYTDRLIDRRRICENKKSYSYCVLML
jgi:hypothetical protein